MVIFPIPQPVSQHFIGLEPHTFKHATGNAVPAIYDYIQLVQMPYTAGIVDDFLDSSTCITFMTVLAHYHNTYFSPQVLRVEVYDIHDTYRLLYNRTFTMEERMAQVREQFPNNPDVEYILEFVRTSKRGIVY